MANWPASLPLPQLPGYGVEPEQAFIRTDFASGPARQRQIFTAAPEAVMATFRLTAAEMATFRDFYRNTIHFGADWFTMTLDLGDGLVSYDCRFKAVYKAQALPGMNWDVQTQIEVRYA